MGHDKYEDLRRQEKFHFLACFFNALHKTQNYPATWVQEGLVLCKSPSFPLLQRWIKFYPLSFNKGNRGDLEGTFSEKNTIASHYPHSLALE
jgi:hypothetical protein